MNENEKNHIVKTRDQLSNQVWIHHIEVKNYSPGEKVTAIGIEESKLIDEIKGQTLNILLDRAGTKLDSFEFSKLIFTQTGNNENIKFFIGGSEGIDQNYFNDFDKIISFGDLTWPHKMFKMMLLEQIYRSIEL